MKKITTLGLLVLAFAACGSENEEETVALASSDIPEVVTNEESPQTKEFVGEKGEFIAIEDEKITLAASEVNDGKAHYFNTTLASGKPVYFFVAKSPDGKLRAAANGCQSCGSALQGFRQDGDYMVCNTCGNRFHLDRVSLEKGGCNPVPISPDLEVTNGEVEITGSQLTELVDYF
jgi:uncharacterized membrane protein